MKYLLLTLLILIAACSQGVRVENQFVDEIQVLAAEDTPSNKLMVIGHKSGTEYIPEIEASLGIEGNISNIIEEEDDIFVVYKDARKILSISENVYDLVKSYDLDSIGEPIDLNFPNTSNGYFSVVGKDSLLILDRISREIANLKIPIAGQPTKIVSKGNRIFVANSEENVLSVVATNLKIETARIDMPGEVKELGFRDQSDELIAVCQMENGQPVIVFINSINLSIIEQFNLEVDPQADSFPVINNLLITPDLFDYAWVGTNEGVYRIDFRNKSNSTYVFLDTDVQGIFFNSREIDNNIFYLGKSSNGITKLEVVDPIRFSPISNIVLQNEVQYIYPFF